MINNLSSNKYIIVTMLYSLSLVRYYCIFLVVTIKVSLYKVNTTLRFTTVSVSTRVTHRLIFYKLLRKARK